MSCHENTGFHDDACEDNPCSADRPLRILEIADSGMVGTTRMGPVSTHICAISNQFASKGHHVTLVDTHTSDDRVRLADSIFLVELPMPSRLQACSIKIGKMVQALKPWFHANQLIKKARAYVSFPEFDIVHAHESILANTISRMEKCCLVYTSHTPAWASPHMKRSKKYNIFYAANRILGRHEIDTINRVSLATCVGSFLGKILPSSKIRYTPNGIDISKFPVLDKDQARAILGKPLEKYTITAIGRLDPVKGFDVLINAIRVLCDRGISVQLNVIGSLSGKHGDSREVSAYAKRLLESSSGLPIAFLGFIHNNDPKFSQLIAASDLVVVPSIFEAQSNVVLEAMALGVPVLGSRVGGIPDMINNDVGDLFEVNDVIDLADKLESMSHDHRLSPIRKNCRNHVQNHFSWEHAAKRYIDAFRSILSETRDE